MTDLLFEVLVWDDDVTENSFATFEQAQAAYDKIVLSGSERGKQLMKYESMDDDASGDILSEDWVN